MLEYFREKSLALADRLAPPACSALPGRGGGGDVPARSGAGARHAPDGRSGAADLPPRCGDGQQQVAARERLTRLLGLWGADTAFTLPARLPDLPSAPSEVADLERRALDARLDVAAARQDAAALAASLGLSRTTRFVNVFELGLANKSQSGMPTTRG